MSRIRAKRDLSRRASKPRARRLRSLRVWITLAWLGMLAAVAYGLHELEPYVHAINTSDMVIEWVGVPEWLHDANWEHVLPALEARIDLHPRSDPYSDRVCPYVAGRLAGSAWVERVRRVSKQIDGRVKVRAEFRKPFAMVERNGIAYLMDDDAVRLPEQWASRNVNRSGWWLIQGASGPLPKPGQRWHGSDVTAGLKLARFLYGAEIAGQLPFREEITAIDVSNVDGRKRPRAGHLQLVTINPQSYIHWGLPPGEEYGIEITAELKLARLCGLHAAEGRLPGKGPIDVRGEDGIGLGEPE